MLFRSLIIKPNKTVHKTVPWAHRMEIEQARVEEKNIRWIIQQFNDTVLQGRFSVNYNHTCWSNMLSNTLWNYWYLGGKNHIQHTYTSLVKATGLLSIEVGNYMVTSSGECLDEDTQLRYKCWAMEYLAIAIMRGYLGPVRVSNQLELVDWAPENPYTIPRPIHPLDFDNECSRKRRYQIAKSVWFEYLNTLRNFY